VRRTDTGMHAAPWGMLAILQLLYPLGNRSAHASCRMSPRSWLVALLLRGLPRRSQDVLQHELSPMEGWRTSPNPSPFCVQKGNIIMNTHT